MDDNYFYRYIQYNTNHVINNDALKIYLNYCDSETILNLLNNIEYLKELYNKIDSIKYVPTKFNCRIIATCDDKEYNLKLPPRVIFHDKV